ncbi:MAG: hypothetical protein KatS3mg050_1002 [Litorilinea sp.]|nr:MAG: hypothetical protein KatS3mg050_1002 [Litorilinea sp.]
MRWTAWSLTVIVLVALSLWSLGACVNPGEPGTTSPAASSGAGTAPEAADSGAVDNAPAPGEVAKAPQGIALLPPESPPARLNSSYWRTDFSRRTVPWEEIISGGPPKDGIPAIDEPTFESPESAREWLSDRDPVILFEHDGHARAYPLAILIWHEIVNDTVGDLPVAVTFCPLCNASIVFERTFDGQVLDFGTTGLLRNSDLIMYDRQTETWWQQFIGQGIVGRYAGEQLTFRASQVISFGDFTARYPNGEVLARPAMPRTYGANPYTQYDSTVGQPFLFRGELDTRLPATERVVGIQLGDVVMAYPFSTVAELGVINDRLGDVPVVVFHKPGTASALDTRQISEGKDVGSVGVFDRRVDGQELTFVRNADGTFSDQETGSTWNILGEAVAGPLAGQRLERILAFDHFWFAWYAFFPQTALYQGS